MRYHAAQMHECCWGCWCWCFVALALTLTVTLPCRGPFGATGRLGACAPVGGWAGRKGDGGDCRRACRQTALRQGWRPSFEDQLWKTEHSWLSSCRLYVFLAVWWQSWSLTGMSIGGRGRGRGLPHSIHSGGRVSIPRRAWTTTGLAGRLPRWTGRRSRAKH